MGASREILPALARASKTSWRASAAAVGRATVRTAASPPSRHLSATAGRVGFLGGAGSAARSRGGLLSTTTAAAAAAAAARRPYSQDAASPSRIWGFKDVQKIAEASGSDSESKVILVDTREPGELQSTGRIPTAINIPITSQPDSFHITDEEFADRFDFARPERDAELVFYCKAGVRGRAAAQLARDAGWTNIGEYSGSWLDWEKNGGKVQR